MWCIAHIWLKMRSLGCGLQSCDPCHWECSSKVVQATDAEHQVDGLSGATITGDGVTDLMHYWFGDAGFKKYLDKLRSGDPSDG